MKASHVHLGVKDLKGAVKWFGQVWQLRPTFENEWMATLPFGPLSIILDAAPADVPATVAFDSENCDADLREVVSRGAVVIEEAADRPWGVRAAYVRGPGALRFEIEQILRRG